MRSLLLCVLLALLSACSQSITVTVTDPHRVEQTIDFGSLPLWRIVDTSVTLRLKSNNKVTETLLLDSNWMILSDTLTKDSMLSLRIRYQPLSESSHTSKLLVVSTFDTVAALDLSGKTSPFERHVGDCYLLRNINGNIDSIRVKSLPDSLVTPDSDFFEKMVDGWPIDRKGNMVIGIMSRPFGYVSSISGCTDTLVIPIGDCTSTASFCDYWGVRSSHFMESYTDSCHGEISLTWKSAAFRCLNITTSLGFNDQYQGANNNGSRSLTLLYCPAIKFFFSASGSDYYSDAYGGTTTSKVNSQLIGFIPGP